MYRAELYPASIQGPSGICAFESGVYYSVPPVFGASGYNWTIPSGATFISGQGTNAIIVDFGATAGVVGVTALGLCGNSGTRTLIVTISCRIAESNDLIKITAFPNPVFSQLNVEIKTVLADDFNIRFTDITGRIVLTSKIETLPGMNKVMLDVSTFAPGVYLLNIKNDKGIGDKIRIVVE